MIKIHLARLLEERDLSQGKLKKMTGIRPGTINAYYHGFIKRFNKEDIDNICEALNCRIEDLIEHIPKTKKS